MDDKLATVQNLRQTHFHLTFQKLFGCLQREAQKKIDNSFYFKILGNRMYT